MFECVDCSVKLHNCGRCHTMNCDGEQLCSIEKEPHVHDIESRSEVYGYEHYGTVWTCKNQPCDYYKQRDRR